MKEYAHSCANTARSYLHATFYQGLSPNRSQAERQQIVNRIFEDVEKAVLANPTYYYMPMEVQCLVINKLV